MTAPVMKDGGERQEFATGAVRDTAEGKPMYRFLPPFAWPHVHDKYGSYIRAALNAETNVDKRDIFIQLYEVLVVHVGHERLLEWLRQGSLKYDAFNWAKGISCLRCLDSIGRHMAAAAIGKSDEDHLAALMCNVMFTIQYLVRDTSGNPIPGIVDFYDFNQ